MRMIGQERERERERGPNCKAAIATEIKRISTLAIADAIQPCITLTFPFQAREIVWKETRAGTTKGNGADGVRLSKQMIVSIC